MSKENMQRDLDFLVSFATSVLVLWSTWELVKHMDSAKILRAKFYRSVARNANRLSEHATTIANDANTSYWSILNQ